MKRIYFISLCLLLSLQIFAQVNPPTIRCITSDTLFFNPATNDCGPFLSYQISKADNENGPFSLLNTIDQENIDFYLDANSSNQISFYLIEAIYDCPSGGTLSSQIISNRPPEIATLQTVSVVNGEVVLTWDPSPSPETVFYSVFLVTDMGLQLLTDTPDTTFSDINNNPNQEVLSYLITANDDCGIQSIFGDPVSSILLANNVDPCTSETRFAWTRHVNTEKQEIWGIDDNGLNVFITEVPADADSFLANDIPNISLSAFFIRAYINENLGLFADSNLSPATASISTPIEEIFISEVQTLNDNTISIEWCWNQDAELISYDILSNSASENNITSESINGSLSTTVNEELLLSNTQDQVYTIQVSSLDVCERTFDSPSINSIALNVTPIDDSIFEINWTEYENIEASLQNYFLHEVINGEDNIVSQGLQNSFMQERVSDGREACYYVEAIAEGSLLDGSTKSVSVISNTACSRGLPIIRLPNAFNPYGVNNIFRPLVGNTSVIESYAMSVFSRYGELLFSSNSPDQGWDGRDGLREMPQGVYTYLVTVEVLGGETILRQGSVLLIR